MMKAFEDTHLGLQFFSSSMSTRHETNHFNIQNDRWSYGHSHQFSGLDILSTCPYLRLIYDCNIIRWTLCVWLIYSAQQSEFWYLLQHFAGFLSVDFWAFHTSNKSHENWERSPKKCMLIFAIISGDELWNGQCSSGRRQSPIDLAEDASVIGRYPNLYFKNYDKLFKNARIINTGHSRKFTIFIVSPVYDRSMKSTKNEVFERAKENR